MNGTIRALVILVLAVGVLATGCAATGKAGRPDLARDAVVVDSRYSLDTVPQGLPPQRAASFRIASKGRQALQEGRLEVAEDHFESALSMDPRNPFCYLYLAEIRYKEGEYRQALLFLNQCGVLFDGHPYWLSEVHARKGQCLEKLNETGEAVRAYRKSLEYNPANEKSQEGLKRIGSSLG